MKDLDEVDEKMVEEEQEEEWRGRAESYELDSFVCVTGYLSGIDILLFNISFLTSNIYSRERPRCRQSCESGSGRLR